MLAYYLELIDKSGIIFGVCSGLHLSMICWLEAAPKVVGYILYVIPSIQDISGGVSALVDLPFHSWSNQKDETLGQALYGHIIKKGRDHTPIRHSNPS